MGRYKVSISVIYNIEAPDKEQALGNIEEVIADQVYKGKGFTEVFDFKVEETKEASVKYDKFVKEV